MTFAQAVNAGVNVGQSLTQPLLEATDPVRRATARNLDVRNELLGEELKLAPLQRQSLAAQLQGQRLSNRLEQRVGPLRVQSLELAIQDQKQNIDFYNKYFGEFGKEAAKGSKAAQGALDYMRAVAPEYPSGFVGPPAPAGSPYHPDPFVGPPAPSPQGPLGPLSSDSPFAALEKARAQVSAERESAANSERIRRDEAMRQAKYERAIEVLRRHPQFGDDVLSKLNKQSLEQLIDSFIKTGDLEKIEFDVLKDQMQRGFLPSGRPIL